MYGGGAGETAQVPVGGPRLSPWQRPEPRVPSKAASHLLDTDTPWKSSSELLLSGTLNRTAFLENWHLFSPQLTIPPHLAITQPLNCIIAITWGSVPWDRCATNIKNHFITGWLGKVALSHGGGLHPHTHTPNLTIRTEVTN